ncbi:MAG: DUF748 domain-containing protein [Burkholderiaceae bacterium]
MIVLAVLILLFAAFGYLIAPGLVQRQAESRLSDLLGRKTTLGSVAVHPFALGITLRDFKIRRADGSEALFSIGQLDAGLSLVSLFRLAPVVNRLHIDAPHLSVTRLAPSRFDFQDIIDRLTSAPQSAPPSGSSDKPMAFSINNIEITNGQFDFDDQVTHSQHKLEAITLKLPFISNIRHDVELFVEPEFSARLDNTPIALKGKSKPFEKSLDTSLSLNIEGLELPPYASFSPVPLRPKLESGTLRSDLSIAFTRDADATPHVKLSGKATLEKLRILKPGDAEAVSAERIAVDLKEVDLLSGASDVNSVEVDAPHVSITRGANGEIDLVDLFTLPAAQPQPSSPATSGNGQPSAPTSQPAISNTTPAKPSPQFHLGAFKLVDGVVHYEDDTLAKPFTATAQDIHVDVADLSSRPDSQSKVALGLSTAPGESIDFDGQASLGGKQAKGHLTIKDVHLPPYTVFMADFITAKLEDGSLGATGDIEFALGDNGPEARVSNLGIELSHFRLKKADERDPIAAAGRIALEGGSADLGKHVAHVEKITLSDVALNVVRDAKGIMNLTTLVASSKGVSEHPAGAPEKPPKLSSVPPPKASPAFEWDVADIELGNSVVGFRDESVTPASQMRLEKIAASAHAVRIEPGSHIAFQLSALANQKGRIELKGNVVPAPFGLDAQISTNKLPLAPFQGYLGDRLNVTIQQADLTVRAGLKMVSSPDTDVRFRGTVEVTDFASLDKVTSADFLRWKSLVIPNIDAHIPSSPHPVSVQIGDVVLTNFYSRLIVYPDARLNVQNVVMQPGTQAPQSVTSAAPDSEPQAAPPVQNPAPVAHPAPGVAVAAVTPSPGAEAGPQPIIRMKSVTLKDGAVNFTDNFVKPNYTTNITALNGGVSSFASDNPSPADVSLKGSLEGNGDLDITGRINPLASPLFVDIAANATDIELTRLTPYAAKYAGYNIEKGKLSMKVKYHIENNRLEAQNNLFLDQLTFGERVDSPSATKLPVLLAVSLLKDTHGQINIDLPISGSLSDPQFSIGGVIVRVILNLLEKALVSPFALLSSIGGGDAGELGYVEFEPGQATLTPGAQAKITKLAGVLGNRPALNLDITGRADAATDTDAAREARLGAKVRGLKYRDLLKSGENVAFDDVKVSEAEYPKYLEEVYKDGDFEKPKNAVGLTKSLPPAEMEQLLRSNMPVNEADLFVLADRRASAVRDALEGPGKIAGSRLFIVASKLMKEPPKDKGSPNRVDFSLH